WAIVGIIRGLDVTNGVLGIASIPRVRTVWLTLIFLAVICAAAELVRRSRHGRVFQLIRVDQTVGSALGLNVRRYRLMTFAVSGGLAGLAGALDAHTVSVISPEQYNFSLLT